MNLEKILRGIGLSAIFALPFICLFVAQSLFFPYITGKNFAFRVLVEIAFGAWIALALVSKEYRPRRSIVTLSAAIFTFIILVADLLGEYPFKSIWSNFERMDGWITLIHVFVYILVASSLLRTERLWRGLMWTSLGVSIYLSIYGFLQIFGFSALGQGGAAGFTARIDATFGNPIYFAAYMLFHVFIAALLWSRSWVERGPGHRLWPSVMYASIIALDTFMLLSTGTRGTILGLVGGVFLTALLVLFQASKSKTAWRASFAGVLAILVLIGGFWMIRDASWVKNIGFLQRMATISTSDNTTKARFYNWQMAWQGFQEKPLLGWGQENYALVFDKYYDPRMHGQEPWFDRVHNIIFDWLVAGGILGLLSYLSIFAAALWVLWRSSHNGTPSFTVAERALLTGLLAGYFCHNFFVFDNVTSYILFATILAYIVFKDTENRRAAVVPERDLVRKENLPFVAGGAVLLVWLLVYGVNAQALETNRALLGALRDYGDVQKNYDLFVASVSSGAFGTQEAREQLAQAASAVAQSNLPTPVKQKFYELAITEMTKQAEESPLDARFPLFIGVVHDSFGNYAEAKLALEKAQELSPKKQSIYYERAQNAELRGDIEEALRIYKEAHELIPEMSDPAVVYAAALMRASRFDEGDRILEPFVANGRAADQRILSSLIVTKQYPRIIRIWEAYVAAQPKDSQGFFTLAAVYFESGDRVKAVETLERAAANNPEVAQQVAELKTQIQQGAI